MTVPLTFAMREALADVCILAATMDESGLADPDMRVPPCSWRTLADILIVGDLPVSDADRTADGAVGHVPGGIVADGATGDPGGIAGFVVLDMSRVDSDTFPPETEPFAQLSPALARQLGYALFEQADAAEAAN